MLLTLFVIGFVLLIKGADFLVDGASSIARRLNISELAIGLTIVAFGTSLPELTVNLFASFSGNTDIAIGNVVGSNIFNVFWILGVSSSIRPLPFNEGANFDIATTVGATLLLFFALFVGRRHIIERWQGGVFILIHAAYTTFLVMRG